MNTTSDAPDRTPDPREWRLDLYPHRDGGWGLNLDGHDIATTTDDLGNQAARGWARAQLGEGVDFVPALFDDLAEHAIAAGQRIDWVAAPDRPLPGGAPDPAIARWRDDRDHLTREALAAYERGDLDGAGEALAHLDVLDDEHHRDTRNHPNPEITESPMSNAANADNTPRISREVSMQELSDEFLDGIEADNETARQRLLQQPAAIPSREHNHAEHNHAEHEFAEEEPEA